MIADLIARQERLLESLAKLGAVLTKSSRLAAPDIEQQLERFARDLEKLVRHGREDD